MAHDSIGTPSAQAGQQTSLGPTAALTALLTAATDARAEEFDARHEGALRLFNGFLEGCPALVVDLYATTLVLHNYADEPSDAHELLRVAQEWLLARFPWIRAVVVKTRHALEDNERQGVLVHGDAPDQRVREFGVRYSIDLCLNRDASLYLDTRNLRRWALDHLRELRVLNTFAYTGALGVAALAGGARRVVQLDLKRTFLNVAKTSYTLNGFSIDRADFIAGDFWTRINQLKHADQLFDCVFVDPPLFSSTSKGTVDLVRDSQRVLNKVRPLISDGGHLVAINNALFVPGADYYAALQALCADGYMELEHLVPVLPDCTGYPQTTVGQPPVDPAPFNHSTKIAVLRVRRKDGRRD
jgi:23S rRNA (cytosine1962-C5)-methyltransferase